MYCNWNFPKEQEQQHVAVGPETRSSCLFARWRPTPSRCGAARARTVVWSTAAAAADIALGNLLIRNCVINYLGLNLKIRRGAIVENIVFNEYAKFNDDRLWNEKSFSTLKIWQQRPQEYNNNNNNNNNKNNVRGQFRSPQKLVCKVPHLTAIVENIVFNEYAKFNDDRLWNEKKL